MSHPKVIHWFRQDLRLADNPSLSEAIDYGVVLPIFILDNKHVTEQLNLGGASKVWLHYCLESLNSSLGDKLSCYLGDPIEILIKLCKKYAIKKVFWNRCYEPWSILRDKQIKQSLKDLGIEVTSFNGSLLWEPWEIKKSDGTPYKVFTSFFRNGCLNAAMPRYPLPPPETINTFKDLEYSISIDKLELLPKINWDYGIRDTWNIGEKYAHEILAKFLSHGINDYKEGRNYPAQNNVSRLSPYLHFGEISPNQVWYSVRSIGDNDNTYHFCSELAWREFAYSLLYFNPDLYIKNLQVKFDKFPWIYDKEKLIAWQKGITGIPIVDAGMRELWQTGYMHNRVRMIVASFLVKNLLIHWNHGAKWFWDCLVDADLANNSASWQWVAGSGADAQPYFRIFNPITQAEKFDPNGQYIRKYLPELNKLPNKYLFSPWTAPHNILNEANIVLGRDYPMPIVDLKLSRNKALEAFKNL